MKKICFVILAFLVATFICSGQVMDYNHRDGLTVGGQSVEPWDLHNYFDPETTVKFEKNRNLFYVGGFLTMCGVVTPICQLSNNIEAIIGDEEPTFGRPYFYGFCAGVAVTGITMMIIGNSKIRKLVSEHNLQLSDNGIGLAIAF